MWEINNDRCGSFEYHIPIYNPTFCIEYNVTPCWYVMNNWNTWTITIWYGQNNSEWMTGGPWYNTYICDKLHENVFKVFIRNARTDRYNIMCSIDEHEKYHWSSCDYGSSGGVFPLPSNSTAEALYLLGTTIYFIGCWLKALEHNFIERCHMYLFNMKKLFQKNPVELPKQPSPRKKRRSPLHAFGGGWYVNKLGQKLPPKKKRRW